MEVLFSIITVTWNASGVILPTLESIKRQSFTGFEYLVIDGASKDDTLKLVNQAEIPNCHVVSEPDSGLYDAMNKALAKAQGKYLIWLNAGDAFATAHTLQHMVHKAAGEPGVIYGQTRLVDMNRQVVGMRHLTAPQVLTWRSFKRGMVVCHQAFAARRDIAPPYDLKYRFSADYDWCIRVLQASPCNAYVGDEPIIDFLTDGLTRKHHTASLKERYRIMCHYYGTWPTIVRHLGFIPRFLTRKLS